MAKYWIGVASADHVATGVKDGFAQLGHGKRAPLARLERGDGLVYYAPREQMGAGAAVQALVAIGRVADDAPEHRSPGEGPAHPWRRKIEYEHGAQSAPIKPLLDRLELTRERGGHWGILFRRSLIAISEHDFMLIARAMHVHPPA